MKKYLSLIGLVATIISSTIVIAATNDRNDSSGFQSVKTVEKLTISVPTVVEVVFETGEKIGVDFAVLENESNTFQPWYLHKTTEKIFTEVYGEKAALFDLNTKTAVTYDVPINGIGTTTVNLNSIAPVTASSLTIKLDKNVALPTTISITADEKIIINTTKMSAQTVSFLQTTAKEWEITLEYTQPLRITEVILEQENVNNTQATGLRFLARPESTYTVYFNADRPIDIETGESGNLKRSTDILLIENLPTISNPSYQKADSDEDGVYDEIDNCVAIANTTQEDENSNKLGDACEDFDRDAIINTKDNCPDHPNSAQEDEDADGIGDACDSEESRFTEKNAWLPWAAVGLGLVVFGLLFASMLKKKI